MSTQSTTESDGSTAATTDQGFSWEQLTLRARGPVERVQRLDEDWTMYADVEIAVSRPIESASDFQALALSARRVHGTSDVVGYLLEEIDGHHLPDRTLRDAWTITVEGGIEDWLALAWAAEDNQLSHPLSGPDGLEILQAAGDEGVADPNCLLALVQWADTRGLDRTRDEWLETYEHRVSDNDAE